MKKFIIQVFTWWNSQTIGTRLHTWRKGKRIGEDEFGNVYYTGGKDSEGRTRRWVIYNGYSEASAIPAGWHGWMHHRTNTPPTEEDYKPHPWQIQHEQNLTGTPQAYRPQGAVSASGQRPKVSSDYDAWTPS